MVKLGIVKEKQVCLPNFCFSLLFFFFFFFGQLKANIHLTPTLLEPHGEPFLGETGLFDSIISNVFEPTAFFGNIELPGLPNSTSLPMTSALPVVDNVYVPIPEGELQHGPLAQNFGPVIQEKIHVDPVNGETNQPTSEVVLSSIPPRLQIPAGVPDLSPNDYDWLLELCKISN